MRGSGGSVGILMVRMVKQIERERFNLFFSSLLFFLLGSWPAGCCEEMVNSLVGCDFCVDGLWGGIVELL